MAVATTINNMGACAHNPRGNLWLNDESTIGRKLLMKMGWSKGKGLGKNEDGIKENLSVKFRNTNSGLGYKDNPYATVMKTEYESILKSLSANYTQNGTFSVDEVNKQENKSCELKSKVIKSRVRYPKLFFGKDVTKYSEKDMKSIFICSLPSTNDQEHNENSAIIQKQASEVPFPKVAETYPSMLSMSDYFAKKMQEKKSKILAREASNDQGLSLELEIMENNLCMIPMKSALKKRKNSETNQEYVNDSDLQPVSIECEGVGTADKSVAMSIKNSSSKKKRKRSDTSTVDGNKTDSSFTIDSEQGYTTPNKKKRKMSKDFIGETNASKCETVEIIKTSDTNSFSSDKKRRKCGITKNESSSAHLVKSNADNGKISCQLELSPNKALQMKKKRKNKKHLSADTDGLSVENSQVTNDFSVSKSSDDILNNNAICSKKEKLKRKLKKLKSCLKNKNGNYSIKNVSFNENVSYRIIDTDLESVECLSDTCDVVQNDLRNEVVNSVDGDETESGHTTSVTEVISSDDYKCNSDSSSEVEEKVLDEKSREGCSLSSLPSPNSPHFNFWIESQRQALKMKIYKSMLKSIKKHKILKTSNLLSIKGYGNWGF